MCIRDRTMGECIESEAGFDDSSNGWKTALGLRSFAGWHHFPPRDCEFSSCLPAQSRQITGVCGHDAEHHFHEIKSCDCNRQFSKLCVCDESAVADVLTSVCPFCKGCGQDFYVKKCTHRCDECVADFGSSALEGTGGGQQTSRVVVATPDARGKGAKSRRSGVPLGNRRAIMYSRCVHDDCVGNRKRVAIQCSCGRGNALVSRQRDSVLRFVDDVQSAKNFTFRECKIVIVSESKEVTKAARRVVRAIRDSVSTRSDTAFRIVRPVGVDAANTRKVVKQSDFHVLVAKNAEKGGKERGTVVFDASGLDEERAVADLKEAFGAFLSRLDRDRHDRDDDDDDERDVAPVGYVRTNELIGARAASRPYETLALNAEWRVETFTWTTLVGTYARGERQRRCVHVDCSSDGSWPVGVVGMDGTCVACGAKGGPTIDHDESLNEEQTATAPTNRADVETMLRLVLSEYY